MSVLRLLDKCLIETLSFVLSVWSASLSYWWGGRNPFFDSGMHSKPDLDRMVKHTATQWRSMCPQNCPGYHAYTDQVTGQPKVTGKHLTCCLAAKGVVFIQCLFKWSPNSVSESRPLSPDLQVRWTKSSEESMASFPLQIFKKMSF